MKQPRRNHRYFAYLTHMTMACLVFFLVLCGLGNIALTIFFFHGHYPTHSLFITWSLYGLGLWLVCGVLYRRYRQTEKVLMLFSYDYTINGIYNLMYPYSPFFEEAVQKIKHSDESSQRIHSTKKQAEYMALQHQINPHFLYNTLESIRGEASEIGADNIAKMTEALASFFRYTISNMDSLVTLEDELANVNSYCTIQKYRFGDRLTLEYTIDPEEKAQLLAYKLPKLILQPVIENAIIHGVERLRENGVLQIEISQTRTRLLITIRDNGFGIPPEQLEQLNQRLMKSTLDTEQLNRKAKGGIALGNVNNRLKLMFGDEYGLYIYSTQGVGTDVQITLPLLTDGYVPEIRS